MAPIHLSPITAALVAVVLTVGSPDARALREDEGGKTIAGVWVLNRELSTPRDGTAGAVPGGGRSGGRGRTAGGRVGRMGRGGGTPSDEERARRRDTLRNLLQAPARLTIVQRDEAVSLVDDQGRSRRFVADGRRETHQVEGAAFETRARWNDDALVVEWTPGAGTTVTRVYRLAEAGRLVVETRVEGGRAGDRPPVRHVYDPAGDAP